MRALVLSQMFPSPCDPTAGIFVLEQIKALRRAGVETVVIAPTPWIPAPMRFLKRAQKYLAVPRRHVVDGIEVEYPPTLELPGGRFFWLYGFFQYLRCRSLVRAIMRQHPIDLIHAHTIMPEGFAAVLLGREFHLPVVCTVHGGDISDYPFRSRPTLWATRWALRSVGHVIAVSDKLRNETRQLFDRDVHLARNGADANSFAATAKPEARTRLRLPLDKKIVIFIGYLVAEKGLEHLLRAFARLDQPDTLLYLVGDGYLRDALIAKSRELGIGDRVVFAGKKPHHEIPLWLSAADCLVLSSVSEGLPTILAEAMICGTPVIATAVGGIPEIIRDGETGLLVSSRDAEALSGAIGKILSDPAGAERMSDSARAFARTHLTWEANAEATIKVYREAIRQRLATAARPATQEI